MKTIILIFILFPFLAQGATGIINNQPTYAVPLRATNVLILDLTLPDIPKKIQINNAGTAQQTDIAKIAIYEDGDSPGWDGDEKELVSKSASPFFGTWLFGDFSQKRIFATVNIASNAVSGRTVQPKAKTDISDEEILGLERKILAGASQPQVPTAPLVQSGEAISAATIRWKFLDLSNNEFGFKILDSQLKAIAKSETSDLSYLDETGLLPSTCYSGRRAVAFNDRGQSDYSANFSEVCTLALPALPAVDLSVPEPTVEIGEVQPPPEVEPPIIIQEDQNIAVRQKIIEILTQLIQLLQEKIILLQASISQILRFLFKF